MNTYLACATVTQSPVHAIVTLESLAALAALVFVFVAYARHQAATHDSTKRPMAARTLQFSLGAWLAVSVAIPFVVHAISGTGWPTTAVCAPAPILQCIGWLAAFLVGIGWLITQDVSAHLRERRAAGQPAFVHTVPMARPYLAGRLAPESSPAPYALREVLRVKPSAAAAVPAVKKSSLSGFLAESEAAAQAALWARAGTVGRFTDSPRGQS
jgi:hypothetical protein